MPGDDSTANGVAATAVAVCATCRMLLKECECRPRQRKGPRAARPKSGGCPPRVQGPPIRPHYRHRRYQWTSQASPRRSTTLREAGSVGRFTVVQMSPSSRSRRRTCLHSRATRSTAESNQRLEERQVRRERRARRRHQEAAPGSRRSAFRAPRDRSRCGPRRPTISTTQMATWPGRKGIIMRETRAHPGPKDVRAPDGVAQHERQQPVLRPGQV